MTQKGELRTSEGEFILSQKHLVSPSRQEYSFYLADTDEAGNLSIGINRREGRDAMVHMLFLMSGSVELTDPLGKATFARVEAGQHNIIYGAGCGFPSCGNSDEERLIRICLSHSFLKAHLPSDHPARQPLLSNSQPAARLFPDNGCITPTMAVTLQELPRLSLSNFCDRLVLLSKTIHLLALQLAQFEELQSNASPSELRKEEFERMQRVRSILHEKPELKLSLRALAHMVGTNEFSLKRNFKLAFGTTVFGYLHAYRMECAKSLLLENNMSISEVATAIGYKYPTHFSAAFKKHFGFPPNGLTSRL